jgi:hypothetical protein
VEPHHWPEKFTQGCRRAPQALAQVTLEAMVGMYVYWHWMLFQFIMSV